MKEGIDSYLKHTRIDNLTLDKIIYSILKFIMFDEGISLADFEPKVDTQNYSVYISPNTSNNLPNSVLKDRIIPELTKHLAKWSLVLRVKNFNLEEVYMLAHSNQGDLLKQKIEDVYDKYLGINPYPKMNIEESSVVRPLEIDNDNFQYSDEYYEYLNNFNNEDSEEDDNYQNNKKNKVKNSFNPYARYCPVCQETPCMCSDPDPG